MIFCKLVVVVVLLLSCLFYSYVDIDIKKIEDVIEILMVCFDVLGMVVVIVENDKVVLVKGFGIVNFDIGKKVNKDILFGIVLNIKVFIVVVLVKLIDEGKFSWDDKVIDYLFEFCLYDFYVICEMIICDLLSYCSGLGLG